LARPFWPTLACITVSTCFAGTANLPPQVNDLTAPPKAEVVTETPFSWLDEVWDFLMFRLSPQPAPDTLAMVELPEIPPASLCLVEPLPVLSDAEALEFEGAEGDSGLVDTLSLTPATATALNRFQRVVAKFGGRLTVTSAYRPSTYQEHLQAVWDRWMQLRNDDSEACQALKTEVGAEFERHQLLRTQRPVALSDHTLGIGFDAAVLLPRLKRSRKRVSIDRLARQAGVRRPDVRRDPVHFRLLASGM
jgi:hypothetical protein